MDTARQVVLRNYANKSVGWGRSFVLDAASFFVIIWG